MRKRRGTGLVKERRNVNLRHVSAIAFESFEKSLIELILN